jgi:hypothetical protein
MRVLAGLLFTVCLFAATPAYAADQVVVRFSSSADSADRSAARASVDATSAQPLTGLTGVQVVTVPEGDAKSATRTLDNTDGVVWAQPVHRMHAAAAMPSGDGNLSSGQWGLQNYGQRAYDSYAGQLIAGTAGVDGNFTTAWDATRGAGTTIGVVDTGVDFSIADLAANREASGYDFVDGDSNPAPTAGSEETSHGTHVAGIAAASLGVNSAHDIAGGAPEAKIMAVRALDADGSGYDTDIAQAFSWAAAHGARVVNASLSGPGYSDVIHQAIAAHPDTLFVVAAGNDGIDEDATASDQQDYPCVDPAPNVVCVAAVNSRGNLAAFSNYGATTVDVGAPGEGIVSYVVGGAVQYWDGTSMATPYASAAAALAFADHPCATAGQVGAAMLAGATAHPLASLAGRTVSGGMIDAAALTRLDGAAAPLPCPGGLTLGTPTVGRQITANGGFDSGTVTWTWERCDGDMSCTTIPGATSRTYTPQTPDQGQRLRVTAAAADDAGTAGPIDVVSAPTAAAPKPAPPAPKPVPSPAPTPRPAPVATPTPKPTPAPIAKPAAPASPKLSLYKPHRRGSKLAVSGRVRWSFHGTVTIKACVGRHCRTVRVKARSGKFSAKLRPSRRGRVVVTASVRAGAGFTAGRATRTARF